MSVTYLQYLVVIQQCRLLQPCCILLTLCKLLLQVTTFRDGAVRINPGVPIPEAASRIHCIRDEHVQDCPFFPSLARELLGYIDGCDLCGFNSRFYDASVLR